MEPGFAGLPLGSTLTDTLGSLFYRRVYPTGTMASVRELGAYILHARRGMRGPSADGEGMPNDQPEVILATISTRSYNRRWVPEVSRQLGAQRCLVITDDLTLRRLLPAGTASMGWNDMSRVDLCAWRRAFREGSRLRRRTVDSLRRRFAFSRSAALALNHALLISSQWTNRMAQFLDAAKPSALLVEYDRNSRGSCLVLAARQRGIPTMTLMHGVINGPFGYTPVLAERVLCWGSIQCEQLVQLGTAPERIDIVGYPSLDQGLGVERRLVRHRLGIPADAMVALLATSPSGLEHRTQQASLFCEAIRKAAGTWGVVRLHPSERLTSYEDVRARYPEIRFTANSEMTLEEAIALGDVSVVHASGFGGEVLAMGGLCVVLDTEEGSPRHAEDLTRRGGAPLVRNATDLAAVMERIHDDGAFRSHLREKAQGFVRAQYEALGGAACRNIASVAKHHARNSGTLTPPAVDVGPDRV